MHMRAGLVHEDGTRSSTGEKRDQGEVFRAGKWLVPNVPGEKSTLIHFHQWRLWFRGRPASALSKGKATRGQDPSNLNIKIKSVSRYRASYVLFRRKDQALKATARSQEQQQEHQRWLSGSCFAAPALPLLRRKASRAPQETGGARRACLRAMDGPSSRRPPLSEERRAP
ncbi:MAG TPA: hypothetical protein VK753_11895, partial [Xanthomonadaceae bacterium]|nr:hypothetical protein [Xanthomonadaceae bacterium]